MVGGGAIAGRRAAARPPRARGRRARALPIARDDVRHRPGALRRRVGDARRGARWRSTPPAVPVLMAGRLVVCPTPIGNLEDVTLRVLAALREADVIACEDTRTTKVLLDRYGVSRRARALRRAHRAARGAAARRADARRAPSSRSSATRGCRSSAIPGSCSCRRAVAAGLAVEVLPGPSAALTALVAQRAARRDAGASSASCRARSAASSSARCAATETLVAFESPRRVAAYAGRARRARSRASGGGLPRADEAPRGGRARARRPSSRRAMRERRRAARSCS